MHVSTGLNPPVQSPGLNAICQKVNFLMPFYLCFVPLADVNTAQAAIKIIAISFLVTAASAYAQTGASTRYSQTGVVTRVVDGDTVWVQTQGAGKPLKLRIDGIDAPEICQAGGAQAQLALKNRVMGQSVTVTSKAHDDYGRTVGQLHFQGQDVARWMVATGHAWVYSFRSKKSAYSIEFAQAQTARRGVFADAKAQEPRQFRKANGACQTSAYRPTK